MSEHDRRLQGTCLSRAEHGRVAGALSHGIRDSAVTQDVTHVVTQEIIETDMEINKHICTHVHNYAYPYAGT